MLALLLGVHGRVRLPAQTLLAQPAPFRRSAHAHVLASKGEYTLTKEWATAAQLRNASEWYCFPGRTEQNAAGYEWLSDPTHGYQSYDRGCEAREALVGEGAGGSEGGFSVRAMRDGERLAALRLETAEVFNGGLFVVNATGTPGGCSAWASVWLLGTMEAKGWQAAAGRGFPETRSRWPRDGEIDLLELVNRHKRNHVTAHTDDRCVVRRTGHKGYAGCPLPCPPHYTVPGKHGSSTRDEAHYCYKPRCADEAVGGLASPAFRAHAAVADAANATLSANGGAAVAAVGARAAHTLSAAPPAKGFSPLRHSRRIAGRALSRFSLSLAATGEPADSGPAAEGCDEQTLAAMHAEVAAEYPRCFGADGAFGAIFSAGETVPVSWSWAERTVKTQNTINWLWSSLAGRPCVASDAADVVIDLCDFDDPASWTGDVKRDASSVPRRHRLTGGAGGAARTCWYQGEHENITEAEASLWQYKWHTFGPNVTRASVIRVVGLPLDGAAGGGDVGLCFANVKSADKSVAQAMGEAYGEVGTSDNCFHEQGYGGCSVDMHEGTGGGSGGGAADGGGVYACEWVVSEAIRCWHFAERSVPAALRHGGGGGGAAAKVTPSSWGPPQVELSLKEGCAEADVFKDMRLVINTAVCGVWAGEDACAGGDGIDGLGANFTTMRECDAAVADYVRGAADGDPDDARMRRYRWDLGWIRVYT